MSQPVLDAPASERRPEGPSELMRLRARGRFRGSLPLLGPAFVASIAYVDPGNVAANVSAGGSFVSVVKSLMRG